MNNFFFPLLYRTFKNIIIVIVVLYLTQAKKHAHTHINTQHNSSGIDSSCTHMYWYSLECYRKYYYLILVLFCFVCCLFVYAAKTVKCPMCNQSRTQHPVSKHIVYFIVRFVFLFFN